jgi:hypothetical protein
VCSHRPRGFGKQRGVKEGDEGNMKLFKAGEDATEPFEPRRKPLGLIALLAKRTIILPRGKQVRLRQEQRDSYGGLIAEFEQQAPSQDGSYR